LKKIDLHIHTVSTISDRAFTFSLDSFKRYVADARLDAVAVTNHDVFDAHQFRIIQSALSVTVFPGIEINVDKGHVLIIAGPSDIDDFDKKAALVSKRIQKIGDSISVEDLLRTFGDLKRYLVIPHYDKGPAIAGETLEKLRPYISAGEVDSAKKFVRNFKDPAKLTPVLFSDSRMGLDLAALPTRQTFVDCGAPTLEALQGSFRDKAKVALSERDGNRLWRVFDNGQSLSTGLNVLLGSRSTGKSHTLDNISAIVKNVKYIRQFSLVQQEDATSEREFTTGVERKRSAFGDQYLSGLKRVLDEITSVNLDADERAVDTYLNTLLRFAEETDRRDAFSNTALFDETDFPIGNSETLQSLIGSVRQVVENIEYRPIIEKHVDLASLRRLAVELIETLRAASLDLKKKKVVNELVKEVKQGLQVRTSAAHVKDVDLYNVAMNRKRVARFQEIVHLLRRPAVIFEDSLQGFRIEIRKHSFAGAGEIKQASARKLAFSDAFSQYEDAYSYLQKLKEIEDLAAADYYRLFAKITYRILNRDGHEVSGGERSEFRLLQEISDAQNYDLLLVDEPESSFDNLFLKREVNQILKSISETMPVVVVTHNSTVGASVDADYILYTAKEVVDGKPVYRIYSGYPTDKRLVSVDGKEVSSHDTLLNSLEAGLATYEGRKQAYEAVKDQ
jgi:ABC-type dipeptide/oligopeptide/nickel transport system ATPase subunit